MGIHCLTLCNIMDVDKPSIELSYFHSYKKEGVLQEKAFDKKIFMKIKQINGKVGI